MAPQSKQSNKLIGCASVAFLGVLVGVLTTVRSCIRGDARHAPSTTGNDHESVIRTIPLELGDGDERGPAATLYPADGGNPVSVHYGTRVERLRDPQGSEAPRGMARVRVLSADHARLVGHVKTYLVQAARDIPIHGRPSSP
jgi:hypothetical protein